MKPAGKKVTLGAMLSDTTSALREVFVRQPIAWVERSRELLRDLPKTNFDLGCDFADQGKWFDAIFRFRVVLFLQPNYPNAWYNLGCCYFRAGRHAQAATALKNALKQTPNNLNARFMLASVDPNALPPEQRPQHMPKEMVTSFFTSVATGYDVSEAASKYQAGKVIYDLVKPLLANPSPAILDLACGTGIVARPWRKEAQRIEGVDITGAMIALAGKATHADKKLFDQLFEADINQLPADVQPADVILLINSAQFIGSLTAIMSQIATKLKPQGRCVISLEAYMNKAGFGLSADTGRFGHGAEYIKKTAEAAGLAVVKEASLELYAGVPQDIIVLGKR